MLYGQMPAQRSRLLMQRHQRTRVLIRKLCFHLCPCLSKHVSASSYVDCSSDTSTHSSAVILKQVSSQVTYNALPYSMSLYRCSFHSPTNNLMMLVLLKELNMNFPTAVSCVTLPRICTEGLCLHLGLLFHNI